MLKHRDNRGSDMSNRANRHAFFNLIALTALGSLVPAVGQEAAAAAAQPDATLFTTYSAGTGYQTFNYLVCGSTQETEGCYDSGSLGPFGRAGALIEGNPRTQANVVTREIYVVDIASGPSGSGVKLYVYEKTDTVTSLFDTVVVKLARSVTLPLTGGAAALCSMAANGEYVFIGTDQSPQAVAVLKRTLAITPVGGFSPPVNVSAITADQYGYVTVTFGGFLSGENGFYVFAPNGQLSEDGGGAEFSLNTIAGLSTTTLPQSDGALASRLGIKPKVIQK
jgi:hypothetical protein